MKNLHSQALRYSDDKLLVLNQQKLPLEEEWLVCNSPEEMVEIIKSLKVRGAPLIGIAAALALAQYAKQGASIEKIFQAGELLKSARPTAVNLAHCIDRQLYALKESQNPNAILLVAAALFEEDKKLCQQIAKHGLALINNGDSILTHCNTGGLVTTGIGTALGIILHAHQNNKNIHIYVDETRPLLQGARLTTWELKNAEVPYTLICDNMAASLMRAGKVHKVIVGADRITKNGDFANKIGTYGLAVLAHYHHIPFYVAAPYTTVDLSMENGEQMIIEERHADEVRGVIFPKQNFCWSTQNSPVFNPAFDITPGDLVTGFILDNGVFSREQLNIAG